LCGEQMALTLAIWVCTLPAVFLLIAPFWGLKVAGAASLAVLAALAVICAGVCSWRVGTSEASVVRKEGTS